MLSAGRMYNLALLGGGAFVGADIAKHRNRDASFIDRSAAMGRGAFYGAAAVGGLSLAASLRLDKPLMAARSAVYKAATWNPIKTWAKAKGNPLGIGAGIPKGSMGPLAGIAMLALGIGTLAMSPRVEPEGTTYASRDDYGNIEYDNKPIRNRMNIMKATGDIIFGLNNGRHG